MNRWVASKLDEYKGQHQNFYNELFHFFGIPTIILSLFIFGQIWQPLFALLVVLAVSYPLLGGVRGFGALLISALIYWVTVNVIRDVYAWWILVELLIFTLLYLVLFFRKASKLQVVAPLLLLVVVFWQFLWLHKFGLISWQTGLAAFVAGWAYQIPGHYLFERNKPAFLKSAAQILIAPLWLAEIISLHPLWRKKSSATR